MEIKNKSMGEALQKYYICWGYPPPPQKMWGSQHAQPKNIQGVGVVKKGAGAGSVCPPEIMQY